MAHEISRIGWLCSLWLVLLAPGLSSAQYAHPGGVVTANQLAVARTAIAAGKQPWASAWSQLVTRANNELTEAPSAVADYNVPGYYDDPVGHELAKDLLRSDVNAAYATALAAAIGYGLDATTKASYRAKAREIVDDWALVNQTVSGHDGPLVMSYVGTAFVTVAELLYDDPAWSTTARAQFTMWAGTVLVDVASIESETNNWGSWGVFTGLSSAYWRGDVADVAAHATRLRALIDSQIDTSGELPLELARGDTGIWYTYFSLAPLTHAAFVLRNATGEDLFHWTPPTGGTLEQALGRFYALALNPGTMDPPLPSNWGGDLLFVMGTGYAMPSWVGWSDPPFGLLNAAWKTPDLLPEPSTAIGLLAGLALLLIFRGYGRERR